ncbi:MAG: hypothetical protein ACI39F_08395 [Acutalibacteraceae bacterium]
MATRKNNSYGTIKMKRLIAVLLIAISVFITNSVSVTAKTTAKSLTADEITVGVTTKSVTAATSEGSLVDDGYIKKIEFNTTLPDGEGIYIIIPTSVFDLNPTRITFRVKGNGNYSSGDNKFYFSNYKNGALPDESDTVVGYGVDNGTWLSINTSASVFSIDLTSEKYKSILTNKLNYFCLYNQDSYSYPNTLTEFYIEDISVYYDAEEVNEFSVNIDGTTVANIEQGSDYVFPVSDKEGFVAYKYQNEYFNEGDKISNISSDIEITTLYIGKFEMLQGATIRLGDVNGMRFFATVSQDKILNLINEENAVIEKGVLIAPKENIGEKDFTFDIGTENKEYISAKYTDSTLFYDTDTFVGSIVSIKDANISREFVGRGYIKVNIGDIQKNFYATYYNSSINENTRTIANIANAYKNDSTSNYKTLETSIKNIVDTWALSAS